MKIFFTLFLFTTMIFYACSDQQNGKEVTSLTEDAVENSPEKDLQIQRHNIDRMRKSSMNNSPCDTISLMEFILSNYPAGTYLVETDKTIPNVVPKPAVLFVKQSFGYILGVIAKSRSGERLIETKNIVGYDQSFIDLDSTKLGTPFFYLAMFHCSNNNFEVVWEVPIPSHGGFNSIRMKRWSQKRMDYIEINFHYGQGTGHINYNYFLKDGLTSEPHLLMTYEGINFKRTIANINDDSYPDYYEHIYYDLGDKIFSKDSVAFVWRVKDNVYVNTRNSKQTRQY